MTVYATYFDSQFLARGAACLRSLLTHSKEATHIYVVALDKICADELPNVIGVLPEGSCLEIELLEDFEARHPELASARATRSRVEYIFTLSPFICRAALLKAKRGDWCVYVDADTYFFSDPALALEGLDAADIAITEHRFSDENAHLARVYGRYNVGWLGFRHCETALSCLDDWAARCHDVCTLDVTTQTFADQKYLDRWPEDFPRVAVVGCAGLNAAPWNVTRHRFTIAGDVIMVDDDRLVLFHFHRLKRLAPNLYETDYLDYGSVPPFLRDVVYPLYIREIEALFGRIPSQAFQPARAKRFARGKNFVLDIAKTMRNCVVSIVRLFSHRRVVFIDGRPLSPLRGMHYVQSGFRS